MKRALAIAVLTASGLAGQCVMCFRTAAAQQNERAKAINRGIVIMLAPPFAILGGVLYLAWRRRETYRTDP